MNVEQLVWWWERGWRTWGVQHGVKFEEAADSDAPDRAAIRKKYGAGTVRR